MKVLSDRVYKQCLVHLPLFINPTAAVPILHRNERMAGLPAAKKNVTPISK